MEIEGSVRFGILTVSDRCSAGVTEDTSGENLASLIESCAVVENGCVALRQLVPDDVDAIKSALLTMVLDCDVVLTTGGTGFSLRDVTPEATKSVIDREAPGLSIAMMTSSLDITKMAMLSRGVCGIRNETLIINLPGSKKSSEECFRSVAMSIPHAVALLRSRQKEVDVVHTELQGNSHHHHHHHAKVRQHQCVHKMTLESKVDVSQVARRARTSPWPCVEVSAALDIVLGNSAPLGTEVLSFRQARGRVLAQDVVARDALPPWPASIKDGYAVIASDGVGKRQVVGDSHAGKKPGEQTALTSGCCVRINTGAPVPPGADAVVQVEDTRVLSEQDGGRTELEVEILAAPSVGLDIRPVGSDIREGQLVLKKGSLLSFSDLGLLATVGVTKVLVNRLPMVSVLSTGNELQDPELPLAPGCIRDSNKTTLLSLLAENGCPTTDVGIATDNPQTMLEKLHEALRVGDIVVTTGSVSMGDRDILKQVITADLKAEIHFGRVLMKPGKPTTFATCEYEGKKKLIFGLPGNPVSASVTCHLFMLPAYRAMCGHASPRSTIISAKLNAGITLDDRPEYHRATLTWTPGDPVPTATSTGNQISSRLLSFASANCLLQFPAAGKDKSRLSRGDVINALLLTHI